jgi:hypothetical protein
MPHLQTQEREGRDRFLRHKREDIGDQSSLKFETVFSQGQTSVMLLYFSRRFLGGLLGRTSHLYFLFGTNIKQISLFNK